MKAYLSQYERNIVKEYRGKWGFQMPDYAPAIIINYLKKLILRDVERKFRIKEIIKWFDLKLRQWNL
jgi:hypothetical protein